MLRYNNEIISTIKIKNNSLYNYKNNTNFHCLKHFIDFLNKDNLFMKINRDFIDLENVKFDIIKIIEPEIIKYNNISLENSGKMIIKLN